MASTGRSSRAVGRPRPARSDPATDPLAAATEVWASVVSGLESARYAEVGTEYAKLSALLVQQRTLQVLAGGPADARWAELSSTAQHALDLLEPLLGAARLLATIPAGPSTSSAGRRARTAAAPGTGRAPATPELARTQPAKTPSRTTRTASTRTATAQPADAQPAEARAVKARPAKAAAAKTPPAPRAATKRS